MLDALELEFELLLLLEFELLSLDEFELELLDWFELVLELWLLDWFELEVKLRLRDWFDLLLLDRFVFALARVLGLVTRALAVGVGGTVGVWRVSAWSGVEAAGTAITGTVWAAEALGQASIATKANAPVAPTLAA